MPAGDAQRAWFPEMLTELESFWKSEKSWPEVISFCEQMTAMRSDLRTQKGIRTPMMTCRSCGGKHPMTMPPISPRSLLFALQKIQAITDEELKQLDKDWMWYRKRERLDAIGHRKSDPDETGRTATCGGEGVSPT